MIVHMNAARAAWITLALGMGWIAAYVVSLHPSMALIFILWVGVLGTCALSERSLLLLFFAFLPFVNLLKRLVYLDATAGSTEMYMVLASQDLLLGVVVLKAIGTAVRQKVWLRFSSVDGAVCALGLYSMLSIVLFSRGAPWTAQLAALENLVCPMIMYFLAAYYLNRSRDLLSLSKVIIIVVLIVSLYGIQQFFIGLNSFEQAWFADTDTASKFVQQMQRDLKVYGIFRTFSTMDSHGCYGILLGIGLMLAWARRYRLGVPVWVAVSLIIAFGLILSLTRYTWIMPVMAAAFVFLFQFHKIRSFFTERNPRQISCIVMAVLIGSFFALTLILSSLYRAELVSLSNPYIRRAFETNTLYARLKWRDILSAQDISILGNGLANIKRFAEKFGFESGDISYHNIFIDMLDSQGVIGLTLFLLLLYLLFKRAVTAVQVTQTDALARRLLVALFALVVAMLWAGHFNDAVFYHGRVIPYFFWGFCGILAHFDSKNEIAEEEKLICSIQTRLTA
jgi:hypothetical protein